MRADGQAKCSSPLNEKVVRKRPLAAESEPWKRCIRKVFQTRSTGDRSGKFQNARIAEFYEPILVLRAKRSGEDYAEFPTGVIPRYG
jgi:hypothetical protein